MFAGEVSPDEVWDCVTHLPRNSATWSAVFDDPETVIPEGGAAEMKLAEYSPEVEATAAVFDAVQALRRDVVRMLTKKPLKTEPYRRPGEARRQAAKARRREQARAEWNALLRGFGVEEA